ncbi:MAG: Tetratricopeptide repeat [Phycisphaerales bacterium]|nr:Tetratricopeptide repeat [Phycisphaerales bacterium]
MVQAIRFFLGLILLAITAASSPAQLPTDKPEQPPIIQPKVFSGDGWAIVAPDNWTPFVQARTPVTLYLIGDFRPGIPPVDGNLSVLKAGLTVEHRPKETFKAKLDRDVLELKTSPAFKLLQDPKLEDVTLPDGSAGKLLSTEFIRKENGRLSIQSKVYCASTDGGVLVATSFITCRRPGREFIKAMGLPEMLAKSVLSLATNSEKVDAATLVPVYEKLDRHAAPAIAQTRHANELLNDNKYEQAEPIFRDAIKAFDCLPAAHNGLAWALLHNKQAGHDKLDEALREANLAVTQSESLDYTALDTLALAQERLGDRNKAKETIERALKLAPTDPDLLAHQKSLAR